MAFADTFDGFTVIHADFLHPTRRAHFEKELKRVGLDSFEITRTFPIDQNDPRLAHYSKDAPRGVLRLIDGFLAAIQRAEEAGWKSVVMLEDDIVFRKNFSELWERVEAEVRQTDWGVLTLHRTSQKFIISEPVSGTGLVTIQHNTLTHCVIVREAYYQAFRQSLLQCIERGYPADFFYGIFSYYHPKNLFATNRNLAGQLGGIASSLGGSVKPKNFYSVFRSGNPLESAVLNPIHAFAKRLRRAV